MADAPALHAGQASTLGVIALGGALGALSRYGVGIAVPRPAGGFPLATFAVNVVGCLLIGALLVLITEIGVTHPLARPFLATGILGGFTTFSTYAVEAQELLGAGQFVMAAGYVGGTLVAAVAATWLGILLARTARRAGRRDRW